MQIGKVFCPSVKQKIGNFAAALHLLLHIHCSSKCYPAKRDVIEYYTTIENFHILIMQLTVEFFSLEWKLFSNTHQKIQNL